MKEDLRPGENTKCCIGADGETVEDDVRLGGIESHIRVEMEIAQAGDIPAVGLKADFLLAPIRCENEVIIHKKGRFIPILWYVTFDEDKNGVPSPDLYIRESFAADPIDIEREIRVLLLQTDRGDIDAFFIAVKDLKASCRSAEIGKDCVEIHSICRELQSHRGGGIEVIGDT